MERTVKIPDVQELERIAPGMESATVPLIHAYVRMDGPAMGATFLTVQEIPTVPTGVRKNMSVR